MFNPILVLVDVTPVRLIISIAAAIIGMTAISSSLIGLFIRRSHIWEGLMLLLVPELTTSLIGIALFVTFGLSKSKETMMELSHLNLL